MSKFDQSSKQKRYVPGVPLPPDNYTGFTYDYRGVLAYARAQGKTIAELSEEEKKKFLIKIQKIK